MPDTHNAPDIDRIPLAHSVVYAVRGAPEVPNQYGPGALAPCEITLTYRDASDSQLGRVHAYVAGRIWVDGKELPLLPGGLYGQHYFDGLDGWPEWLVDEARLHDPAAAPVPPPADRAAAYRLAADAIRDTIAPADWPSDAISIWNTVTNIAEHRLRRMAAEEQTRIDPDTCWTNPNRPPEQCPNSEFDGYGLQCQKPAGHNLCTFEEEATTTERPAVGEQPETQETDLTERLERGRQQLLEAMSAVSEDRTCTGWAADWARTLHAEGGIWETLGRAVGWPTGNYDRWVWVSWDEAAALYAQDPQ